MIEFLLAILYFVIFCLVISKMKLFKDEVIPRYWFISLFGLKVIVSIILTAIYTNYYTDRDTADIFKYFDDSKVMFDALKTNSIDYFEMLFAIDNDSNYFNETYYQYMNHWVRPYSSDLFSDSHVIIRFNAFVRLFSFGHFQVHNVFINFISLSGLTLIYKAFKSFLVKKEKLFFISISIVPSVLFWGSGLLKESIIFLAIGMLMYGFIKANKKITFASIILIVLSILLIIYTKFYLLIALSIPMFGYILYHKLKRIGYVISIIAFIGCAIVLPKINSELDIIFQVTNKQQTFSRFIESVPTNSGFILPHLTDGMSIVKNIPNSLLNTFIRPFPWECTTPFMWLSFLENLLVILFIVFTVYFRKSIGIKQKNIFYLCISFVIGLFILIGLTTPVFGAIVRYKIPGLLFLFIAILIVLNEEKLKARYKFLNSVL